MQTGRRTAQQFLTDHRLPADWRVLGDRIEATFVAGSFSEGARFLPTIAALADAADHHPDVDLRYPGALHITLVTHASGGLTRLDAELATALSAAAAEAGLRSEPTTALRLAVRLAGGSRDRGGDGDPGGDTGAFWAALLGYRVLSDGDGRRLVDPRRINPPLLLSAADEPAADEHGTGPDRTGPDGTDEYGTGSDGTDWYGGFHLELDLADDVAAARVATALAHGGAVLSEAADPPAWRLADPGGRRVTVRRVGP